KLNSHQRPTIYCSKSNWTACKSALSALNIHLTQVDFWIADYTGRVVTNPPTSLYPNSIGHQYIDYQTIYDVSVITPTWTVVAKQLSPTPTPQPPSPSPHPTGDTMPYYTTNSAGTGFVITVDLAKKRGIPTANDAAALLATGFYRDIKLSDTLINAIPNA